MASYLELETIAHNPAFQMRCVWALRKAAEDIANNPDAPTLQKKIADKVRRNNEIRGLALAVQVLQNSTIAASVTGEVSSATDDDIQFVVNGILSSEKALLLG